MNRAMRRIAVASFGLVGLLAAWLTLQQAVAGSTYGNDPRNARALPSPDDPRRGPITTADGIVTAEDRDGVRVYPEGGTYLHLVGFSAAGEASGLEETRRTDLHTLDDGSITSWLITLFGGSVDPPELRLTVVDRVQRAAVDGLRRHTGAAVAIDPSSGAILAYASAPTLDPNEIVLGEISPTEFFEDESSVDRVAFRLLPPGSTFKLVVAAGTLESGATPETLFEDAPEYLAPGAGLPITNVSGGTCDGSTEITLRRALAVSCNSLFARLAVELGGEALVDVAERARFNAVLPFELGAAVSSLPSGAELDADPGALAQTGIGERDVRTTPLQMAVMTAALGNGGEMMRPYVVDSVIARDGSTLDRTNSESLGRFVDTVTADDLVSMMVDVVEDGTGRAAQRSDVTVAGKTGTAEGGGGPHSWFVALAPAEAPTIAIVVVIEGEGTGGTVAAPIAARMLDAWLSP